MINRRNLQLMCPSLLIATQCRVWQQGNMGMPKSSDIPATDNPDITLLFIIIYDWHEL